MRSILFLFLFLLKVLAVSVTFTHFKKVARQFGGVRPRGVAQETHPDAKDFQRRLLLLHTGVVHRSMLDIYGIAFGWSSS